MQFIYLSLLPTYCTSSEIDDYCYIFQSLFLAILREHQYTVKTYTALSIVNGKLHCQYTVVPVYPQVIRSETYHGYVKPRIILNVMYVIFV
jgi:hypothetical protein